MTIIATLKSMLEWCRAHWKVVAVGVVSIVSFVIGGFLFGNKRRPDRLIKHAMEESKAMEAASKAAIEKGKDTAVIELEKQHEATLERISETEQAKLDALRGDPAAFAKHLTKLSRG